MDEKLEELSGHAPYKAQLPSPQQVAAVLAVLSLAAPMALGGMPVLPVTIEEKKLRHQDEIQQISSSSVGIHQTPVQAEASLALSQQRLAFVAGEVEEMRVEEVREQDVLHAANRVFTGGVNQQLTEKFRSAFTSVAWDTVDLFILRDNEEH